MNAFLHEDFLLDTELARRLYHEVAAVQPIIDYHCHLPPAELAEDRQFENLTQIWLAGDHYKWRAMRIAGVAESCITGEAPDYEKFLAWAQTVPQCIGNPLYVWTHLELKTPFGIDGVRLDADSAERIWASANQRLAEPEFSARGLLRQMRVRMVGTTDDPVDDLAAHRTLAASEYEVAVLPTFRPDRAFKIDAKDFRQYIGMLEQAADQRIRTFDDLLGALTARLDHFAAHGCRMADHGIEWLYFEPVPDARTLDSILQDAMAGKPLSEQAIGQYFTAVNVWLGREYARRGWVMQYHIGALRSNNTRMLQALGPNTGFDSIGDQNIAVPLARLLDAMDRDDMLPKTILYGINPRDNEVLATMAGNFPGAVPGKVQYGAAWWFNDQRDGMQRQLTQLSQLGLLSRFIGMLTDSRSFLSYTRHEYFRRILCSMIGDWVAKGEAPGDWLLLAGLVEDVCYRNAERYFDLQS